MSLWWWNLCVLSVRVIYMAYYIVHVDTKCAVLMCTDFTGISNIPWKFFLFFFSRCFLYTKYCIRFWVPKWCIFSHQEDVHTFSYRKLSFFSVFTLSQKIITKFNWLNQFQQLYDILNCFIYTTTHWNLLFAFSLQCCTLARCTNNARQRKA